MPDQDYFTSLNQRLQSYNRAIPFFLIDLDRLDHNLNTLKEELNPDCDFRIVVKSLPSLDLIDYIAAGLSTNKLMVFDEGILGEIVQARDAAFDILLGKPMPARTALHFYKQYYGEDDHQNIQWLIDTEDRLQAYIQLSRQVDERISINLEIDVGLHRGGFNSLADLERALSIIENVPDQLNFCGFTGYDPHIGKIPRWIQNSKKSLELANTFYKNCQDLLFEKHPNLTKRKLTFNGGGSLTLALHQKDSPINEVAAGSLLLKPGDFDVPVLKHYQCAGFIATPILKKMKKFQLPGSDRLSNLFTFLNPSLHNTYFIYGGHWLAHYCYPPDMKENKHFGKSTNQAMVNSRNNKLAVNDYVFLKPNQSELVMRQFEEIVIYRKDGKLKSWKPI